MPNPIFVFGSNETGIHGAGAATDAYQKHGALWGIGEGYQGSSYAIPTKDHNIKTLPLRSVKWYVKRFLNFAKGFPQLTFRVTQIGCGLAGFTPDKIAPMFRRAPSNRQFSSAWAEWLPNRQYWTDK
ncbi:hypothetical protein UFOVP602_23 [uncultured Caudovirales phage]|jgi:hypothetical protein|uniref:Uncharacterized protein n=1 Tax=uncultured Caudovirales phage TaxID=2100421 RepID=A0A6J5N422_9CAUD|nr:hypothetical protein UFOVP602_23 [uncultured Caudovirales phage]